MQMRTLSLKNWLLTAVCQVRWRLFLSVRGDRQMHQQILYRKIQFWRLTELMTSRAALVAVVTILLNNNIISSAQLEHPCILLHFPLQSSQHCASNVLSHYYRIVKGKLSFALQSSRLPLDLFVSFFSCKATQQLYRPRFFFFFFLCPVTN